MKNILLVCLVAFSFVATAAEPTTKVSREAISPHSHYSNYYFDGEHGGGANLWIWKKGDKEFIGLFHAYEGDVEDGPGEPVTNLVVKPTSIAFDYRQDYVTSDGKPMKGDLQKFTGKVVKGKLDGKLAFAGRKDLTPLMLKKMKSLDLKAAQERYSFFKEYKSLDEWRTGTKPTYAK